MRCSTHSYGFREWIWHWRTQLPISPPLDNLRFTLRKGVTHQFTDPVEKESVFDPRRTRSSRTAALLCRFFETRYETNTDVQSEGRVVHSPSRRAIAAVFHQIAGKVPQKALHAQVLDGSEREQVGIGVHAFCTYSHCDGDALSG